LVARTVAAAAELLYLTEQMPFRSDSFQQHQAIKWVRHHMSVAAVHCFKQVGPAREEVMQMSVVLKPGGGPESLQN
jgi:hypothetical protein